MSEFSVPSTTHIRRFLASPAGGASVLLLASLLGLVLANSSWASGYGTLITTPMKLPILGERGPENIDAWVSDGLMTLFFLVVILEIKRKLFPGTSHHYAASPFRLSERWGE